jgi:hypothetical protein
MPSLDDVYRKFGETSEAAQLLETELGNQLLVIYCTEENLFESPNASRAKEIYSQICRCTLGQLIRKIHQKDKSTTDIAALLTEALKLRNHLAHSFYLHHNLRRNSEEGRELMMQDLASMHDKILEAYKAIMLLSGVDIEKLAEERGDSPYPSEHLPI